ncbi:putative ribonuclease H-like domain-containing protein [Tanacetum coccineum]|uniref:Ribonuclease H-like domain-containing protein n=1 Tax=Tanacetum coccineum TaxID=301880 RepID=A0ABQ4XIK7_9ASTR
MVLNNTKHKILHPWWWYYDDDGGGVVLGGSGVRRVAAGWRRGDDGDVGGGCGGVGASMVRQPEEGATSDMGDRFSWVFFLRTKDETSGILKDFIRQIENQLNQKVKTIRCDNGTEFKNREIIEFCGSKGIKREYSNARTPQQNEVAKRKNRTLIDAAITMLADSFLPTTFWAEAVSTACYILNRLLVTKPQNKTPYELITGIQDNNDAGNYEMEAEPAQEYFVLPLWSSYTSTIKSSEANNRGEKPNGDIGLKTNEEPIDQAHQEFAQDTKDLLLQAGDAKASSTNYVNTASTPVNTARPDVSTARPEVNTARPDVGTARQEIGTADPTTPLTTTAIFNDEEMTLADTLVKMKDNKAKGVIFKDIEELVKPERSVLTLKPLPSIDPKDKGKGVLEEPKPAKKMTRSDFDAAQAARDAEVARQLEVELHVEVERERQREEQTSMDYIANLYDEVQAKIDVDHELVVILTHEEQEKYTVDERAKLLAEFFERRKKQLAEERDAAMRNKPPTRTQLRSLMMTYLKHTDGVHVEKVLEEPDSTKVEVKQEAAEQGTRKTPGKVLKMKARKKRKGGPRMKRQSKRKKTYSDLEEEEHLKTFLKIVPDEEGIIDLECIYYRIFRSDGSSIWIKSFSEMVTRFDRLDLVELYNLVTQRFETTRPKGVDLVLWGDLRTMFEVNAENELWRNQEGWNLKSWDFYENYGFILSLQVTVLMICFDSFKSRLMKQEAMMEERRIFKCWFHHHPTNGHQFTMSNRHQELASLEQTASGKDFSNPLMADSLPKTIWFSTHHASQ